MVNFGPLAVEIGSLVSIVWEPS